MRFLTRSALGLFLTCLTLGLLALAALQLSGAMRERWAGGPPGGFGDRERVFSVELQNLEIGAIAPELVAFGEVRSRRSLSLRAPAAGEVVELSPNFSDGGSVVADELLLRIDPALAQSARDTALTDLAEAEANLSEAETNILLAEEDVTAAQLQAALRAQALERQRDLETRGVGTPAAVETAELAAAAADQAVLARRQALAGAEARRDQAEIAVTRRRIALAEAERVLAETELHADFTGVLSNVSLSEGGLVSRNEEIARLIDPRALEVAFRVSTAQYLRLLDEEGDLIEAPVTVVLDVLGLDITAQARLDRESGAVEEGASGRLIFARFEDAPGFRPGDFVTLRVQEPELRGVTRLPATALSSDNRLLLLGPEDRLEEVEVRLLRRQGDEVVVAAREFSGREVVRVRTPVLGAGILVRPLRPDTSGDLASDAPETIALDPERRARLVAYVEGNVMIPADVKDRILRQLQLDEVPARVVARIEQRMGG